MDHESRSSVCPKKGARDRLIRLLASHPDWALGFQDETWWSRLTKPNLFTWAPDGQPLRLVERSVGSDDPDPKALAAYGMLIRQAQTNGSNREEVLLRFVDGRPVSSVTTRFLEWVCERLSARGKTALLMLWDNAPWHVSKEVRTWIREHNRHVKREAKGVRIIACYLPIKSPWLNPIEPHWIHAKRKTVDPAGLLSAHETADRVCAHFQCPHERHLAIPENAA